MKALRLIALIVAVILVYAWSRGVEKVDPKMNKPLPGVNELMDEGYRRAEMDDAKEQEGK